MTPKQVKLVQQSWSKVEPIADTAAAMFYDTLFELDPGLRSLFKGDLEQQGKQLMTMIGSAVTLLNNTDKLVPILHQLGHRHASYKVTDIDYQTVAEALLKTLRAGLGTEFTAEVESAWIAVYGILSASMIEGASTKATSPASKRAKQVKPPVKQPAKRTSVEESTMSINEYDNTAFFKSAIDQSGTASVMVDRDLVITYANKATLNLMRQHEATFQKKYPGFSAAEEVIIGSCIDSFHANPSHQRRLLSDPSNLPWVTDIQVEHLTFELNVTGIFDDKNEYIGNALEWQDVTAARASSDRAAQLQGAVDQSGTAQVMIDRDLIITYANPATLALMQKHESTFQIKYPGFSAKADKIIGTCIDVFHTNPAHQRKLLDNPNNLPWKTDIQIEHLSFELNVTAINDARGNYIGNTLEWQDVTELRNSEEKNADYAGQIEAISKSQAVISFNMDGTIIDANDNFLNTMGYTFNEIKDKHHSIFVEPEFKESPEYQEFWGKLNRGENQVAEFKRFGKGGKMVWIQASYNPIVDENGKPYKVVKYATDITENQKKAVEMGRLSSAVKGMSTNLMMADTKGNIVYMNPAVEAMLRRREMQLRTALPSFNTDKVIGTNFDTFHKNPAHQQNLLGNPDNLPYNADIAVAGLEFNLNAIALKDAKGEHVGTAVQWIDTTEEKDAQRQIEGLITSAIRGELDTRINTDEYQGFMKGLGTSINQLMDNIVEPVTSAIDVTQALAKGDLSKTMDGEYGGEFLALANAVNDSMNNLRNMVGEIRNASSNVFSAAREIAQGNTDLSHRTESQASSLEETASAMEELTTTVQQNAENATQAAKLSNGVMEKASSGSQVVTSAVTAMEEIDKSSTQIADIIGVIDEIAFQTNLLALNAAVEAARAGEQGRGFAVVAAEVRNLAQRSAAAAKEIKGLIKYSVEAVGKGTKLVDETGRTFSELVGAVQEVVTMIADIDSASKEQAAGINEVSQAVAQMDEMTQQNAALVEEAAASSKSMEEQSQELLDQVAFFQSEQNQNAVVTPITTSRSAAPARPSLSPKTRPDTRKDSQLSNDEEWQEF